LYNYFLGIDLAKAKHCATLIDRQGQVLLKPFTFRADRAGFSRLYERLTQALGPDHAGQVQVGMEATGHLWMPLYEALMDQGYAVVVLNPLLVAGQARQNLRGRKSDPDDSRLIARILLQGEHQITRLADEEMLKLRELCRQRFDLMHTVGDLKNRIISLLGKIFPEYDGFFSDTFGQSSRAVLEQACCAEEIAALSTVKLTNILKKASRNRFGKSQAQALKGLAQDSTGITWGLEVFTLQMQQHLEHLRLLENHIAQLDQRIADLYGRQDLHLESIPGLGPVLAPAIAAEIGDVGRFRHDGGRKLLAFAGLDPRIRQSGQYQGRVKMTKRGSPYLRTALYMAANRARLDHPLFVTIYQKQRDRGKPHNIALSHVANKLCHVLYAVMRDHRSFESKDVPVPL
jgi:transposase